MGRRRADPVAALHEAGSRIVGALTELGRVADVLDADSCRELLFLAEFDVPGAKVGYTAGPPRALSFSLPVLVPRFRLFRSPEAPTQYRKMRAALEAAMRGALDAARGRGRLPRSLEPFGPGAVLWLEYGHSPEGGPFDVDNVWIKAVCDGLQAMGVVEDDRCLSLVLTHRPVSAGETFTAVTLVDFQGFPDPFEFLSRARSLAGVAAPV